MGVGGCMRVCVCVEADYGVHTTGLPASRKIAMRSWRARPWNMQDKRQRLRC